MKMMTQEALCKRRALIVRRQAAYRASLKQREVWRKRRGDRGDHHDDDMEESAGEGDLLVELPDSLLG